MKTIPRLFVATLAVLMFGTGATFAREYVVKRFEHPNGQPNFAYVPVDKATGYQDGQTIAFYGRGRSALEPVTIVETEETFPARTTVRTTRRQVVYEDVEPW